MLVFWILARALFGEHAFDLVGVDAVAVKLLPSGFTMRGGWRCRLIVRVALCGRRQCGSGYMSSILLGPQGLLWQDDPPPKDVLLRSAKPGGRFASGKELPTLLHHPIISASRSRASRNPATMDRHPSPSRAERKINGCSEAIKGFR